MPVLHGRLPVLGFRIGNFAYLTDCNRIPEASWPLLQDLDILVLDALRHKPHPTHFTLAEAIATARRIGARQTWFTHMTHDLPHAQTCADLPDGMSLAWDGLELDVPTDAAPGRCAPRCRRRRDPGLLASRSQACMVDLLEIAQRSCNVNMDIVFLTDNSS